jgi:hypothetical protein
LAHFAVSSALNLPNSAGVIERGSMPRPARRLFTSGLEAIALMPLLSVATVAAGVPLGAPMPSHALA